MPSQIFRRSIPIDIAVDFLEQNCFFEKGFYVYNFNAFKKAQYNGSIDSMFARCNEYYFFSKKKYLENKTINGTATVLRQIFNYHSIPYTSKIKYAHSTYSIEYYFSGSQKNSQT
jgi:hypothetical protein